MYVALNEAEKMKELVGDDATKESYDAASELRDECLSEMIEKSPMKEAYILLGARSPLELYHLYCEEDQKLIKGKSFLEFNYDDPELVINKVRNIVEAADPLDLAEEERTWQKRLVWFWYHHAISAAIAHGDKEKAQEFSKKALQYEDSDNKITRLLYYLVHDMKKEAEDHLTEMKEGNDPDGETAEYLLKMFNEEYPFSRT